MDTEQLARIEEKLDIISEALFGDPTDPNKPGYFLRIDRIEQKSKSYSRILWIFGTGVLLAIIGNFFK